MNLLLSKNLSMELLGETRAKILESLLESDETASELSMKLKIIQPGVRRHLDYMKKLGIVDSFFRQTGLGRPKKYYKITPLGRTLFPKMYDFILSNLISKLDRANGEVESPGEKVLTDIATDLATGFSVKTEKMSLDDKLKALEKYLNQLGFAAKVTRKDDQISILRSDCALYNVALSNYRRVCFGFDSLLISKCLGERNVRIDNCMALGKRNCHHTVTL